MNCDVEMLTSENIKRDKEINITKYLICCIIIKDYNKIENPSDCQHYDYVTITFDLTFLMRVMCYYLKMERKHAFQPRWLIGNGFPDFLGV